MTRILWTFCALSAFAAIPAQSSAQTLQYYGYVANLEAMQEVPPNVSPAMGTGIFVIDVVNDTISYRIEFGGLTAAETAAHFHGPAGPGVNAGVLVALPAGNPKAGVWNYPAALEPDVLGGRIYVNIHSAAFPGGEIRGQVVTHAARLSSAQEVPPNASTAAGFGCFVMDPAANTLAYYIAYGGLSSNETAAHFHGMAPSGVNAGVLLGLAAGSPKVGVWSYLESQEGQILSGMTYVNIHTTMNPGGEIRGQVVNSLATMQALQEVPPNGTTGVGVAHHSHDLAADRIGYFIRYGGLTGAETASHIHGFSPRGINSGVKFAYAAGAVKNGFFTLPAADEPNYMDGLTYNNVHTAVNPGGEIRGQIEPRFSCWGDSNRDNQVDLVDVAPFVNCLLNIGPCACSDVNFDGTVNGADIAQFIMVLLTT